MCRVFCCSPLNSAGQEGVGGTGAEALMGLLARLGAQCWEGHGKQVPMEITLNKKAEWRQAQNHTAKVLGEQ